MGFFPFARNCIYRTVPEAEGASSAGFRIDGVRYKRFTLFSRAPVFIYMRLVFVAEIFDGGENRVW